MAKLKSQPARVPLPLSFVEGEAFALCLTAGQVRKIREQFPEDDDGKLVNFDAYMDAVIERAVVDADGGPLFAPDSVAGLFDPWYREVRAAVTSAYSPADPAKNSPAAPTSPAS